MRPGLGARGSREHGRAREPRCPCPVPPLGKYGEVGVGGQGVRTCGISRDEQGAADPLLELRWAKLLRQVLWNAGDTGVLAILDISAF